ncbi:MAG: DUF4920 domain-containing protein [Cyclobacteriaceae bacterium]|nr:DUF4920 domain-containing protein [Cyclobacteriaceae bacterium HetDA_MAG_MS6]
MIRYKILVIVVLFAGCDQSTAYQSFGEEINSKGSIALEDLGDFLALNVGAKIKIDGEIGEVCQSKGCWMVLDNPSGYPVRVTFKDYQFFVPTDVSGRQAIVEGQATIKELSPEEAQHFAEDAGRVYDPNEPVREISIVASGVLISEK